MREDEFSSVWAVISVQQEAANLSNWHTEIGSEINTEVLKISSFSYFLFLFAVVVAHVAVSENLGLYVRIL